MRDSIYVDAESGTARPSEQEKQFRCCSLARSACFVRFVNCYRCTEEKAALYSFAQVWRFRLSDTVAAYFESSRGIQAQERMLNALRPTSSLLLLVLQNGAVFPSTSRLNHADLPEVGFVEFGTMRVAGFHKDRRIGQQPKQPLILIDFPNHVHLMFGTKRRLLVRTRWLLVGNIFSGMALSSAD